MTAHRLLGLVLAAIATCTNAFSSITSDNCLPLRDCIALPAGWNAQAVLYSNRTYKSDKTAAEVWSHIIDHEAFYAVRGMRVLQAGFGGSGVGLVRGFDDTIGIGIRQLVSSMVEESHYSYQAFLMCGPFAPSTAPSLGFCNASVQLLKAPTGWTISIQNLLVSNNEVCPERWTRILVIICLA
uniref:Uncharacterized protein n=2 Tax=Chrysotila carterae TaxID=13221 RepID=A0A6S9U163_CHRCT|eukprot:6198348-Pleurochrysis_carterae.AAC.1